MKNICCNLTLAFLLCVQSSERADAAIQSMALGTGAPPATLGSFTMTPFGDDTRAIPMNETSVPSPLGGSVGFSIPLSHVEIGSGWATWSHGYAGDVYTTNGAFSVDLTLPALTGAFYLYAEPNPFSFHTITATSDSGATVSQSITGQAGAGGYGFYSDASDSILSITISSLTTDFAIGEFGIALQTRQPVVPEPTMFAVWAGLACVVATKRRR